MTIHYNDEIERQIEFERDVKKSIENALDSLRENPKSKIKYIFVLESIDGVLQVTHRFEEGIEDGK